MPSLKHSLLTPIPLSSHQITQSMNAINMSPLPIAWLCCCVYVANLIADNVSMAAANILFQVTTWTKDLLLTSPADDERPQHVKYFDLSPGHQQVLRKQLAVLQSKWKNGPIFPLAGSTLVKGIQHTSFNPSSAYKWSIVVKNLNVSKATISHILIKIFTRLGLSAQRVCTYKQVDYTIQYSLSLCVVQPSCSHTIIIHH